MFKNKKVVLSSVAIIFTLIVSAVFVNFTLANSGTPVNENNAELSAATGLVGYSNIDLAVINSNSASLKATGDDKYRIVQILPKSKSNDDIAKADTDMTAKVTASNYKGNIKNESDYTNTTPLWKYVYDGEYFRYAVFDGYKTIASQKMAAGAVTLTTVTVDNLNSMDTNAKAILSAADFIYIVAPDENAYASKDKDISEALYNWLVSYTMDDRHPIVLDKYTLCVKDASSIKGNNDTYRMGTLAFKLITKNLTARIDNVLAVEPGYFNVLYKEASDNDVPDPTQKTTKTISDFILTAERSATEGGNDYINKNRYYKWYEDNSLTDFLNFQTNHSDSAYIKVSSSIGGITASRTKWDFDNAEVLVISNGESSRMFDELAANNDSTHMDASAYTFNKKTNTWEAEETAENSVFTGAAYASRGYRYVPSGANIYVLQSRDIKNALTSGEGAVYSTTDLSNTGFQDVATKELSGEVRSSVDLTGSNVYLTVTIDGKTYLVGKNETEKYSVMLSSLEGGNGSFDSATNTYVYNYNFSYLNAGSEFQYGVIIEPAGTAIDELVAAAGSGTGTGTGTGTDDTIVTGAYEVGSNGCNFIVTKNGEQKSADYDYTNVADTYAEFTKKTTESDPAYDANYSSNLSYEYTVLDYSEDSTEGRDKAFNYVNKLYLDHKAEALTKNSTKQVIDFTQFDFIFIESGAYKDEIGKDAYKSLCDAVEGGVYVIASDKAGDGVGSGDGDDDNNGGNKTIISPSAKAIADIINAGQYRDGSDNKFKVLEIQPDYPIDRELAETKNKNSSYSKHMDGSEIKGDYYTVPSDVIEGKAKEELQKNVEYYDFDLTKAKLAYAIDGLNYGDIELTQVSTEALIGMKDDIATSYDLVYIGGDYTALDRSVEEVYSAHSGNLNGDAIKALGYGLPTFIMYTHTGMLEYITDNYMPADLVGKAVYMPENGNDLTKTKYDELVEYIDAGKPVIFGDELTSVYEKMQGYNVKNGVNALTQVQLLSGYWFKDDGTIEKGNYYLDPSSRVYKLVKYAYDKKAASTSVKNVLWGYDHDDTQMIDNQNGTYGQTLYTAKEIGTGGSYKIHLTTDVENESWFQNDDPSVIKSYAVVPSDTMKTSLNSLIKSSASRVRVVFTNKPATYKEGITSSYLRTTSLPFEFEVRSSKSDATYTYKLYCDKDRNMTFDSSDYHTEGTLTKGAASAGMTSYTASTTLELDEDFFGSASWYLEIYEGTELIATSSGLSKVVNETADKNNINVLQIQTMYDGQTTDFHNFKDTLYFDIQSQWAHKIMYYNGLTSEPKLGSEVALSQYKSLGRHENRFGIVQYDLSAGDDNWYSNLADTITDDYNINLDMAVINKNKASFTTADNASGTYNCLEQWVADAETLSKAGGKVDGMTRQDYADGLQEKWTAYQNAKAAVETPKENIDKYLEGAIDQFGNDATKIDTAKYGKYRQGSQSLLGALNRWVPESEIVQLFNYCIKTGDYSMIFMKYYGDKGTNFNEFGTYGTLFTAYRDAKDAELNAKDEYYKYLRRSYGKDFLKKMYSILVLGPSAAFSPYGDSTSAYVDMNATTCQYIKDYVKAGGDLFFFHDTMSPYSKKAGGAYTLTTNLLDMVGLNRFHVDLTNQKSSYAQTNDGYEYKSYKDKSDTYYLTPYGFNTTAGISGKLNQTSGIYDSTIKTLKNYNSNYNVTQIPSDKSSWNISALSMSYLYFAVNKSIHAENNTPYIYSKMDVNGALRTTTNDGNRDESAFAQTAKASRLNEGLVTLYPFAIGSSLNISGTHQQAYSLDLEATKTTVWYTLAGCNNNGNAKTMSSYYAASPYDGMESYFIYTTAYGNGAITYCGAGHTSVTGNGTKNNDERKLFINVIINSALASVPKPDVTLFQPDTNFVNELGKDESAGNNIYLIEIADKTTSPNFDAKIDIPDGITVDRINVYYDLDLNDQDPKKLSPVYSATNDKLIWSWKRSDIEKQFVKFTDAELKNRTDGKVWKWKAYDALKSHLTEAEKNELSQHGYIALTEEEKQAKMTWLATFDGFVQFDDATEKVKIRDQYADNKLKPSEECFAPYGGNYTYIIVEVYYGGEATPVQKIIKVKASDPLFNLTQNNTNGVVTVDGIEAEKYTLA